MDTPDDTSPIALGTLPSPSPTARRDEHPAPRSGDVLRLLGFAAVPTVIYFVLVLRKMTYAWDDFIQFGVTLQAGVGLELLKYSLFEHLGPLNRLVHAVLLLRGGLDPRWAIAICVVIFFAYCLALTDLARVLGASWGRTAICVAVATVTPASVFVAAFLDPYFHVMTPLTALIIATAAYVRWTRSRRFVHAATAALACLVACAVQERGSFILLFLLLARLLVIEGGVPVRAWVRTLLRDWRFLLLPALIAVVDAAVVALYYAADSPRGGLSETFTLVWESWVMRLVPMVTGVYQAGSGAIEVTLRVVANLVVVALVVMFVRRNVWNVRPVLLLVLWFGFNMTFIGVGRLGVGALATFRDDPNFYAYAMPAVVIVIASLRAAPARLSATTEHRRVRRTAMIQFASAAVLAVLVVVSAVPLSERAGEHSPDYLAASVSSVRAADRSAPAVVAPTRMPYGLAPPGFFPYNSGEFLLKEIDRRTAVDVDPSRPRFLDASGKLTSARAQLLSRMEPGASGTPWTATDAETHQEGDSFCVDATGSGHLIASLPAPVATPGGAAWVRLVATGGSSYGAVAAYDGTNWAMSAPAPLTSARHSVSFMVPSQNISRIELVSMRAVHMCFTAIEVWGLTADGAHGCGWVGPSGKIVAGRPADPAPGCPRG